MRRFSKVFMTLVVFLIMSAGVTAETIQWIPAAASNQGRHGTRWTTDLWIYSPVGDSSITVYAAFFPEEENPVEPAELPIEIDAYNSVKVSDAVFTLFGENRPGAIRLRSDYPFEARSRTANVGNQGGSVGQAIPAVPEENASDGSTFLGAANLPGAAGVRTNVGVLNLSDRETDVFVLVLAPDPNEPSFGQARFTIGPRGWWQGDLFELIGIEDQAIDDATVFVGAGRHDEGHIAYLSRVDNASGDGTFIRRNTTIYSVFVQTYSWKVEVTLNPGDDVVVESLKLFVDENLAAEMADPEDFETFDLDDVVGDYDLCLVATGQAPQTGGNLGFDVDVIDADSSSPAVHSAVSRRLNGSFEIEDCTHVFPRVP